MDGELALGAFPAVQKFWEGGEFKFMGSGIRYHKIAFFSVKVYDLGLYVETDAARAALQKLKDAGRLGDYNDDVMCTALLEGGFNKLLQIHMLRSVALGDFFDSLNESLEPRLAKTGDTGLMKPFEDWFQGKSLSNGSNMLTMWEGAGSGALVGDLFAPGETDFASRKPGLHIDSANFSHALFDIYMGTDDPKIPPAKKLWAQSARDLIGV
ncbi:hypothetical protein WJX72_010277 [[Myrmecia] bisecta]|uniref:Chalcone isomerase domain-containing protein n=1 Tax=[Myrmecia] bisecta TaxID=41462 RepID=A0AAW1PQL6_9CHLO